MNTVILTAIENEICNCPRCRRELERGVTLIRVRGKRQMLHDTETIGGVDRMREVLVVIVRERGTE